MIFEGSAVALVTPFDKAGEVNYQMLKKLIEFQIANGTQVLVILGTTGESSTISKEEREKIIKFSVCLVGGRVPVIVGTGSNSTKTAIELTLQAKEFGADACLVVTPYYNKCSGEGLILHYKAIANAAKFPIIAYSVPSRTGVNITPALAEKLSKIKYVVGLKEASGNVSQMSEILSVVPKNFAVYSGDDGLTLPAMSIGAKGVVSVTANCFPSEVQKLCTAALEGDFKTALAMHKYLQKANKAMFLDVNPICVKAYLNEIGFDVGKPRLPLCPPSSEVKNKLKEVKKYYEN